MNDVHLPSLCFDIRCFDSHGCDMLRDRERERNVWEGSQNHQYAQRESELLQMT